MVLKLINSVCEKTEDIPLGAIIVLFNVYSILIDSSIYKGFLLY